MNSAPRPTSPLAPKPIPNPPSVIAGGSAPINVSILSRSHGSGKASCNAAAREDLPELEPPLSTITVGAAREAAVEPGPGASPRVGQVSPVEENRRGR